MIGRVVIDPETEVGARVAARLRDELVAWLVTVGADGTPAPTPVWFWWDGETLLVYTQPAKPKLRHIASNPRVALALRTDVHGDDLVVITGDATVDESAPAAFEVPEYVEKYRDEIARLGSNPEEFSGGYSVPIRIRPTKVVAQNGGDWTLLESRSAQPMPITHLNHAVLFVRDADAAAEFYRSAFGFEELSRMEGMRAVFMRSPSGGNHHDLGLFEVGPAAPRPQRGSVGLYHLAWEIDTIEGLAEMASRLRELGALSGASDHGVSKSLYGQDPDGNEFEVMWQVPREAWGEYADQAAVMPLDLDAEVRRWGSGATVQ